MKYQAAYIMLLMYVLGGGIVHAETNYDLSPAEGDVPIANRGALDHVIDFYRDRCSEVMPDDASGGLIVSKYPTYEMVIDDNGVTATVLYTDFSCGDLGPIWCGTGGCDTYIFVDGKTFAWLVSFPPYTFKIPNPYNSSTRTAVMFPLNGGYCKSAGKEQAYGSFGCYEIALWDEQRKTFMTRSGALTLFDPLGP